MFLCEVVWIVPIKEYPHIWILVSNMDLCDLLNEIISFLVIISRIAITTKGKYTALDAQAIPALVELVDDPCSEVRINTLKVSQ